jgi:hypothetical protein
VAPQELAALAKSDPAVLTVSDEDMRRALESALTGGGAAPAG